MSGTGKYRQVVDKNDVLIGHKWKEEFDPANDIYRISALWLRNAKDEVFIAQRALAMKNGGGQWGPAVAGTLEYDETYEDNIAKEIAEEIGLTNLDLSRGEKRYEEADGRKYFCVYFYATVDEHMQSFSLQEEEVAAGKWVDEAWLVGDIAKNPGQYVGGLVKNIREIVNDRRE